jgi:hypothetical protein
MRVSVSVLALLFAFVSSLGAADDPVPQQALRTAVEKGLDLLVKTSPTFIEKGGCNSCHPKKLPPKPKKSRARGSRRSRG